MTEYMTVRELRELLAEHPDEMRVYGATPVPVFGVQYSVVIGDGMCLAALSVETGQGQGTAPYLVMRSSRIEDMQADVATHHVD